MAAVTEARTDLCCSHYSRQHPQRTEATLSSKAAIRKELLTSLRNTCGHSSCHMCSDRSIIFHSFHTLLPASHRISTTYCTFLRAFRGVRCGTWRSRRKSQLAHLGVLAGILHAVNHIFRKLRKNGGMGKSYIIETSGNEDYSLSIPYTGHSHFLKTIPFQNLLQWPSTYEMSVKALSGPLRAL